MKKIQPKQILFLLLAISLTACNYPGGNPLVSPTPTIAPTATPTETPLPPTDTPPPPPTDTPPPPPTQPPPPTLPPTATATKVPTAVIVTPMPGAKFSASFTGGTFTFRINPPGRMITLKEITLSKATCSDGKNVSTHLTFEDIKYFPIENGKFTITFDRTTISGQFITPTTARGLISIKINANKGVCQINTLPWTASAVE
ncbi:MAG: hypothetical protein QME21_14560 [Anaerolineales bacterium]|nr:hypothetical protein [Anaerolineales bacterium]